jgi:uncharacterized protein with von Willebrand factor type A (vWA) domain
VTARSDNKLAHNILLFARTLRSAGIPIGTSQVIEALIAVARAGIERREDLYWALRAFLVKQPAYTAVFDQAFHLYFRNPRLLERMMALLLPTVIRDEDAATREQAIRRLSEAVGEAERSISQGIDTVLDQSGSYSHREMLRAKDFEQMSLDEQREARQLLLEEILPLRPRPSRRFKADSLGDRFDLRRSLRLMQRGSSDYIPLARKRRVTRRPDVILICDISGSMSSYSRMFLHFAHALTQQQPVVHSFVFGTRLTCISHRLATGDVDESLRSVAGDVKDFDGGTRIAECLRDFNQHWTRRVLARDSRVVLLSDGLERDAESDLEFQMTRLHRSCRRLIWMNPMLRYEQFEPKALGIRKMLPHVDLFVPAHNIHSLTSMWRALQDAGKFARTSDLVQNRRVLK